MLFLKVLLRVLDVHALRSPHLLSLGIDVVVINKLDFPIESLKELVLVYVFCICDRRLRENEHDIPIFKKHDPTLRPPEA